MVKPVQENTKKEAFSNQKAMTIEHTSKLNAFYQLYKGPRRKPGWRFTAGMQV